MTVNLNSPHFPVACSPQRRETAVHSYYYHMNFEYSLASSIIRAQREGSQLLSSLLLLPAISSSAPSQAHTPRTVPSSPLLPIADLNEITREYELYKRKLEEQRRRSNDETVSIRQVLDEREERESRRNYFGESTPRSISSVENVKLPKSSDALLRRFSAH